MQGEDPVLIPGELGEPAGVIPHALVGGMEQMGAVAVDFDSGLRFGLRVGVPADVRPPLEDQNTFAELARNPFGHGEAEEPGADDEEVVTPGRLIRAHRRKVIRPR